MNTKVTKVTKAEAKDVVEAAGELASISATTPAHAFAVEVANKLFADEEFNADLNAALDAEETRQRSPLYLLLDLREALGSEVLAKMPVPDSTEEDVKGTNRLPDWYATLVKDKDGIPKAGERSFYADLAEQLGPSKPVLQDIADIKAAQRDESEVPPKYIGKGKPVLASLLSTANARLRRIQKSVATAVALEQQMERINNLPHVICDFATSLNEETGETELVPTNLPMMIAHAAPKTMEEKSQIKAISISSFLSINTVKAAELGGTFTAVMKAMERKKRKPKAEGEGEATGLEPFTTVPEAADALNELYAFLDDKDKYTAFMRRQQKPDEIGDDLTVTMGDLYNEIFAPWWEANKARYQTVVERRASQAEPAKAASK